MTAKSPLMLDVTELAIVRAILVRHVPDAVVWVFGSRATGQSKKYSDLDLCIKASHPLDLDVMSALAESFSESDLPWKVDLVDWYSISDVFRAIIDRDKLLLQQPSSRA
jgi:type I restriction enzyme S subunit